MKPRIAIIFTGGTIAMKLDVGFGGIVPSLSATQILDAVPMVDELAEIEAHEFGRYPGPHMTPQLMFKLSQKATEFANRDDIDGIIVTHGTDTLEETAFFLDCTVKTDKPIVVVGAMRNSSEPDWDGPRNLRDAIIIASNPGFRGMGTLVCLSDVINAASEVSKTDTNELNTFASFDFGPVARIINQKLTIYRSPLHREQFSITSLPSFVPLFKCYSGMDGELIRMSVERGARGIVIEAFGVGNVPPPVYYALLDAIAKGIPVVLVSRCPVGRIEHVYAYEGAGKGLHDAGVIFADYMNGQKARIKLMVALGAGYSLEQIRHSFEWAE
ncbi:MAG: asparaginase [Ignavibacteriae bacterium]|nr:asparaginase [Ignavibacteriota bacterium]